MWVSKSTRPRLLNWRSSWMKNKWKLTSYETGRKMWQYKSVSLFHCAISVQHLRLYHEKGNSRLLIYIFGKLSVWGSLPSKSHFGGVLYSVQIANHIKSWRIHYNQDWVNASENTWKREVDWEGPQVQNFLALFQPMLARPERCVYSGASAREARQRSTMGKKNW